MARAGIPIRAASANRSSTRAAPSSIEYSVWTWRCTKLSGTPSPVSAGPSRSSAATGRPSTACGYIFHRVWTELHPCKSGASVARIGRPINEDPRAGALPKSLRHKGSGENTQVRDLRGSGPAPQPRQHLLEVSGQRLLDPDLAPADLVRQGQPPGVQERPPEAEAGRKARVGAVGQVSGHRVAGVGEVD